MIVAKLRGPPTTSKQTKTTPLNILRQTFFPPTLGECEESQVTGFHWMQPFSSSTSSIPRVEKTCSHLFPPESRRLKYRRKFRDTRDHGYSNRWISRRCRSSCEWGWPQHRSTHEHDILPEDIARTATAYLTFYALKLAWFSHGWSDGRCGDGRSENGSWNQSRSIWSCWS